MRLRRATPDDVELLVEVVLEAHPADDGPGHAQVEDARRRITADVEAGDSLVIESSGAPIGRLHVLRPPGLVEISGLQILPAYQSRGIGTQVLRALIEEAQTSGRHLELTVRPENLRAQSLYRRLGFTDVGEQDAEIRMRWRQA